MYYYTEFSHFKGTGICVSRGSVMNVVTKLLNRHEARHPSSSKESTPDLMIFAGVMWQGCEADH
jgi:hypothetical protein